MPLLILSKLLDPLFKIRFAQIPTRIGPLSSGFDAWVNMNRNKEEYKANLVIFAYGKNVSNPFLLSIVKKNVFAVPNFLLDPVFIAMNLFPPLKLFQTGFNEFDEHETVSQPFTHTLSSPIRFLANEMSVEIAREVDCWNTQAPVLAICLRDKQYNESSLGISNEYAQHRDYSIKDCKEAFEFLLQSGYSIIRAGNKGDKFQMKPDLSFFDYPNSRIVDPENDLKLFDLSSFVIGVDTGLIELALLMRKSVNLFNLSMFTNRLTSPLYQLVNFNTFMDTECRQELGLQALKTRGVFTARDFYDLESMGVQIHKITPDDLVLFVQEVIDFNLGNWVQSGESKEIRDKFLFYGSEYGYKQNSHFFFPNYWAKKTAWLYS